MRRNRNTKIVILGAGLAGLSTAYYLKKDCVVFEKEAQIGGLCRSRSIKGFTFDIAGHLLHFKRDRHFNEVKMLLKGNFKANRRDSRVWFCDRLVRYPFGSNLFGLPPEVVSDCLRGLRKSRPQSVRLKEKNKIDFKSWVLATFGEGIARRFMFPYNEKFWKYPLETLNAQWAKEWIPVPTFRDVLEGVRRDSSKPFGYNARFWYPQHGGIQSLVDALKRHSESIRTGCEAAGVDLKKKEIIFQNGLKVGYTTLISTLPLPELIRIAKPLPEQVRKASLKLKYISIFNVNLGLNKKIDHRLHWIYFPQQEISFYRMGFASNFSKKLAPQDCSSLYFEFSYSQIAGFNKNNMLENIRQDCLKFGLKFDPTDVIATDFNDIKYGYCVYDHERDESLRVIRDFLKSCGIFSIGRYGSWKYASMEDVMEEARQTAGTIQKTRRST